MLHAGSACPHGCSYNVTYVRLTGGRFKNTLAVEYFSIVDDYRGVPVLHVIY